jgi:DNA-directed RNA polymerase subunit E"
MKERACRKCRRLTTESICPNDGSNNLGRDWSGLIVIIDPERSSVARSLGVKNAGRYALRVS